MNLVDSIHSRLDDEVIDRLATALGENSDSTRQGLTLGAVPAILQGILTRSGGANDSDRLNELLLAHANDPRLLTNIEDLLSHGKVLLGMLLGDRIDAVAEVISSSLQLRRGSVNSLLALTGHLVISVLGKSASVADLSRQLSALSEAASIPGLANALGVARLGEPPAAVAPASEGFHWPWIIVPLTAILLGYALNSCQQTLMRAHGPARLPTQAAAASPIAAKAALPAAKRPSPTAPPVTPLAAPSTMGSTTPSTTPPATSPAAAAAAPLPPATLVPPRLADVATGIPKNSAAYALAKFLADPEAEAPRSFVLRNLNFTSGTADIARESQRTLIDVAHVLKAFGNARVMLEGHTDNVGGPDSNYELSQARANAAQDALIRLGIAPARLTAAGFGAARPLAGNDSAAGRKRNRRTELLVTVK